MAAVAATPLATPATTPIRPRVLGSGRLSRSGRTRLVKLSSVENSIEESRHILNPAQKKLTTVESQRVMTVVQEMKRKIEGALLLPQLHEHLDRFAVAMGTDMVAKLKEYYALTEQYLRCHERLLEMDIRPDLLTPKSSAASTISLSHAPRLHPVVETPDTLQDRFHTLQRRLRHSTRSLLRDLNQCPSVETIHAETLVGCPPRVDNVLCLLGEVAKLMEETLLTTHDEEVKRYEYITAISELYQEAEVDIAGLQAELQQAKDDRDKEVQKREEQKKKLLHEIRITDKFAKEVQKKVESETNKQEASNQQSHESRLSKLKEELATLKKTYQETKESDKQAEIQLRKKSFKRETEADNWIQKYDNEIGELQTELETLETEFDEEKKQVKEIEERLEVLSIEYEMVVKEQEEARQRAEEAKNKMSTMVQAATMIQSCWRAYKFRKSLNKDQKGKKGKKGGKKGKKGGSGKKGGGGKKGKKT